MLSKLSKIKWPLAAAVLAAAATAAVAVAQNERESDGGEGDRVIFEHRSGPGAIEPADREALEAHRKCMAEQGAPVPPPPRQERAPEPPKPLSEAERAEIAKALEACEGELPEGMALAPGCAPGGPHGDDARGESGEAEDADEPGDVDEGGDDEEGGDDD